MSCQQASRTQEDPYAFTESAPLQANSLLYANHSSAVTSSSSTNSNAPTANSTAPTIVSSGASLLLTTSASNSHATKDTVVVAAPASQPLRVGSSPTLKVRYNGVVTTATTAATVSSTMGVQRAPQAATATPVFSKPVLQIKQQSPGQTTVVQPQLPTVAVGKQIKKVLPQQKPAMLTTLAAGGTKVVSPLQQLQISPGQQQHQQQPTVLSTAGGSILKFIKIPPHQLAKGVSASGGLPQGSFLQVTTSADGGRKLLATSSAGLNSTISVTSSAAAAAVSSANRTVSGGTTIVPTLPTVSPTKIRLIQPQSQGKIYLQAPNSNSLAATTHISNPISIAALRNSLVKQQQQQQQQQVTSLQPQVVHVPQQPLGQPLKQQQVAQPPSSVRTQLQTQQALQLQQTQQSQLVLQQAKQKQSPLNASAQPQPLQTKQAPKQGKQLTEVQQQVQKQQLQQSLQASLPPASQQSVQGQEGVNLQTQGIINQHVRQVHLQQPGVPKSSLQMHHQPQVVQTQQKQSLLLQQQPKQLPSPPQQPQLLVQHVQQRKQQPSPQSQVRGRQGQPPLKAGTNSPPITATGEPIMATSVTNGSHLVKVNNTTTNNTASTMGAANVVAHGKPPAALDNQARRSTSGQQSLLIGATTENPAKPLSQHQPSGGNIADSGRTVSLSPSGVMRSDAKRELVTGLTNSASVEITEGGNTSPDGRDSLVVNSTKPASTPLNERNGKVRQTSGRKSGSGNKPSAKQSKPNKRPYNHRSVEERQDSTGCVPPPTHSQPNVASSVHSSAPSESFQAAFAKMARPAVREPQYPNEGSKSTVMTTPKPAKVKKESARKLFGGECDQEPPMEAKPAKLKFVAPKVPGAIAVPITRPKVKEWHAPGSYMFDLKDPGDGSDEEAFEGCPNTLSFWYEESIAIAMPDSSTGWGMHPKQARGPAGPYGSGLRGGRNKHAVGSMHDLKFQIRMLTRDERLELKKAYLQRRAVQCRNGLRMRNISAAKRKLESMATLIKRVEKRRLQALSKESERPKCTHEGCDQAALVMASHCYNHITENPDQRLFQRCTAKFADNSQCRLPVFDISHELVLCKEHAWKHDNHDKMSQEVKSQKKPVATGGMPFAVTSAASNVTLSASRKKAKSALTPPLVMVRPQKRPKKKKKLSPLQQQLQLHQQQHKQFVALNQQQHAHCVQPNQPNAQQPQANGSVHAPANIIYQQQQRSQQHKVLLRSGYSNGMVPQPQPALDQQVMHSATHYDHDSQYVINGGMVGSVPVKQQLHVNAPHSNGIASMGNRNMHIPLISAGNSHSLDMIESTVYQSQQDADTPMQLVDHQLQHHGHQQGQEQELQQQLQHQALPDDQLMLSYMQEQQLHQEQQQQQQQHQHQHQHHQQQQLLHQQQQQLQYVNGSHSVQPMLNATASQDLLTICENSSAYASSEDTGVGGLSESELMATQEVIEEIIPFEIGNLLNPNVLSQLAPDALNELLFAGGEQDEHDAAAVFESTTREVEDDIERALEHVKSLDEMGVESANFLGDFLENVDDEMLDGADICSTDQMLQSPNNANDIRGLVHT